MLTAQTERPPKESPDTEAQHDRTFADQLTEAREEDGPGISPSPFAEAAEDSCQLTHQVSVESKPLGALMVQIVRLHLIMARPGLSGAKPGRG